MAEIKGAALIQVVRGLRSNRAVAETLVPVSLHNYLNERLLASSWYPEADWAALILALGKMIAPGIKGDVWEYIGSEGATHDFNGIYSSLIRKGDPWASFAIAQKIWRLYRDTGRMVVKREVASDQARILLHDYPSACPEICGTITGYLRTLTEVSGGTEVQAKLLRAPPPAVGPSEWLIGFKS
jgi:hypothetical protein